MVTRFGTPIALLIALTVLLAACGGDSVDTPLDDGMLGDDTTADTGGDDVDDGNDAGPPAPIGLRIAFVSERDGNPEIYTRLNTLSLHDALPISSADPSAMAIMCLFQERRVQRLSPRSTSQ